jgi:hypothetical protein
VTQRHPQATASRACVPNWAGQELLETALRVVVDDSGYPSGEGHGQVEVSGKSSWPVRSFWYSIASRGMRACRHHPARRRRGIRPPAPSRSRVVQEVLGQAP